MPSPIGQHPKRARMANGQGTETYANGDTYTGEYKDGQRNGQGTMTDANGTKRTGEFKDGEPVP